MPVFDTTLRLLADREIEIVDISRDQSYIETKRALYAIVEDTSWNIARVYAQFSRTILGGKNFAIHGPRLNDESINEIGKMGFAYIAKDLRNAEALLATTEMQVARNVDAFEVESRTTARGKK